MATMTDYDDFCDETGRLIDWVEANRLGIASKICGVCTYGRTELRSLQDFCRTYDEYHLLSQLGPHVVVNRVDPRARLYLLGNGNSDPSLNYVGRVNEGISLAAALKVARE